MFLLALSIDYCIDDFAKRLGFKDTSDMADAIHELKEKLHLRNDLKDLKISLEGKMGGNIATLKGLYFCFLNFPD